MNVVCWGRGRCLQCYSVWHSVSAGGLKLSSVGLSALAALIETRPLASETESCRRSRQIFISEVPILGAISVQRGCVCAGGGLRFCLRVLRFRSLELDAASTLLCLFVCPLGRRTCDWQPATRSSQLATRHLLQAAGLPAVGRYYVGASTADCALGSLGGPQTVAARN